MSLAFKFVLYLNSTDMGWEEEIALRERSI